MICPQCGSPAPDDQNFCVNCGSPLAATKAPTDEELHDAAERAQDVIEDNIYQGVDLDSPFDADSESPADAQGAASAAATAGVAGAAGVAGFAGTAGASPEPPYTAPSYGQPDPIGQQQAYQQPGQQPYQPAGYAQPQQTYSGQTPGNRALAMCLYTGLLALIFGFVARDNSDEFITHHLNQALVILIGCVISCFLSFILIGIALGIFLLVVTIMGMVSAYNGEMKELPLIGKIKIVK